MVEMAVAASAAVAAADDSNASIPTAAVSLLVSTGMDAVSPTAETSFVPFSFGTGGVMVATRRYDATFNVHLVVVVARKK